MYQGYNQNKVSVESSDKELYGSPEKPGLLETCVTPEQEKRLGELLEECGLGSNPSKAWELIFRPKDKSLLEVRSLINCEACVSRCSGYPF